MEGGICCLVEAASFEVYWYCCAIRWSNAAQWARGVAHVINQFIQQGGWNCTLVNPPAQSPDLKLLHLGLFHLMKSNADGIKGNGRNIDTSVERMEISFEEYSSESISIV